MLAVPGVLIIDDMVAELTVENFQLQILGGGFTAGPPADVFIVDNECK